MAWNPVPVDFLEAEPADVRRLAEDLRTLAARLLECGSAFRAGAELPPEAFDGLAGDRFRSTCRAHREVALDVSLALTSLAGAADELARDLDDFRLGLQQMRGIAHEGGLEVGGAAIWPPHPTERHVDTPALRAAWAAYDRCWALRDTLEAKRDAAGIAWRSALVPEPARPAPPADPVEPVGVRPPRPEQVPAVRPGPDPTHDPEPTPDPTHVTSILERVDRDAGTAPVTWVPGARDTDGVWVPGHWAEPGRHPVRRPPSIA